MLSEDFMEFKIKSLCEEDTLELGRSLAKVLEGGTVIALDGDLGAGKTVFTRGFCEQSQVTSHVSSPTFTIVNEYLGGTIPIYHFDTYRLEGPDDFLDSGLDEYFDYDGICIIEWSSVIEEVLPKETIKIEIRGVGNERDIKISFDETKFDQKITDALKNVFEGKEQ